MDSTKRFETPILFITFRRPGTTKRVFDVIRHLKPAKLYVAQNYCDDKKPEIIENWTSVRNIIENVEWDCEVKKLYRTQYLDAKSSISSAISWFFKHEPEGIILEDDCLPDMTFFRFCADLLEKYRNDDRIASISGNNFQFGRDRTNSSYYFSRYPHIWGWASWRRTWNNYDVDMKYWPEIRDSELLSYILKNKRSLDYWTEIFNRTYNGEIDTWDYQLTFTCWIQNQLNIIPNKNLVSNIGFGMGATHTKDICQYANMKTEKMHFPLNHPGYFIQDFISDDFTERHHFSGESIYSKMKNRIRELIS